MSRRLILSRKNISRTEVRSHDHDDRSFGFLVIVDMAALWQDFIG